MAETPPLPGPETSGRLGRMPADSRAPASRERDEGPAKDPAAEDASVAPALPSRRAYLGVHAGWWGFLFIVIVALVIYFGWNP